VHHRRGMLRDHRAPLLRHMSGAPATPETSRATGTETAKAGSWRCRF
jgi:hypothetical protein